MRRLNQKVLGVTNLSLLGLITSIVVGCAAGGIGDGPGNGGTAGSGGTPNPDPAEACTGEKISGRQVVALRRDELGRRLTNAFPSSATASLVTQLASDSADTHGFSGGLEMIINSQRVKKTSEVAEQIASSALMNGEAEALDACVVADTSADCGSKLANALSIKLGWSPLAAPEADEYGALYAQIGSTGGAQEAAKWTIVSMLNSPNTLYRYEIGVGGKLTASEMANKLAYAYSGAPPDAELLALASDGSLGDPAVRKVQAKRLITSAAGRAHVVRIAQEWLRYGKVQTATRADIGFAAVRDAYYSSMNSFVEASFLDEGSSIADLLSGNRVYTTAELSTYLGIGGDTAGMHELPAGQLGGLLGQPGILAATAGQDRSSPTLRGLTVYEHLFCLPRPVPPANVGAVPVDIPDTIKTTRQLFEEIHLQKGAGCAACHAAFDPLGYGFESYDEYGRFRTTQNDTPIDPSGKIPHLADKSYTDSVGLGELLASTKEVGLCVSGLWATVLTGGDGGHACSAPDARALATDSKMGLIDSLVEMAGGDEFSQRSN